MILYHIIEASSKIVMCKTIHEGHLKSNRSLKLFLSVCEAKLVATTRNAYHVIAFQENTMTGCVEEEDEIQSLAKNDCLLVRINYALSKSTISETYSFSGPTAPPCRP